jgi:hypothetical protein
MWATGYLKYCGTGKPFTLSRERKSFIIHNRIRLDLQKHFRHD